MRWLRNLVGAGLLAALPSAAGPTASNLGLATGPAEAPAGPGTPFGGAALTGFVVSEADQGGIDRNGDGDALDFVAHLRRAADAAVLNLGRAVHASDVTDPAEALYASAGFAAEIDDASPTHVVFRVSEEAQGHANLNGDPDREDFVAHVTEGASGTPRNLGVAVRFASAMRGRRALLGVFEADQRSDRNGDGDLLDVVLHVYDAQSQTLANLGLAVGGVVSSGGFGDDLAGPTWSAGARWVALGVPEAQQGGSDLNADGDASDVVLHVHDLETGATANRGLAIALPVRVSGNAIAFAVIESAQAATDLNGDGDTADAVAHVLEIPSGTLRKLGLATLYAPADEFAAFGSVELVASEADGGTFAFVVPESEQGAGGSDRNGDGDTNDHVAHVWRPGDAIAHDLGLVSAGGMRIHEPVLVVDAWEGGDGADRNGDGDAVDLVPQVVDLDSLALLDLGLAAGTAARFSNPFPPPALLILPLDPSEIALGSQLLVAAVSEAAQGGADRNGDGDALDHVAHALPAGSTLASNLGLAVDRGSPEGPGLAAAGARAALVVAEGAQGGVSRNGDADAADRVLHLYASGSVENLGLDVRRVELQAGQLLFEVREPGQGTSDLDGDADAQDDVLHVAALDCGASDPDPDADGVCVSADNCPFHASADLADTDLDGRGDVCECSDQNGDGRNTVSDLVAINRAIFFPAQSTPLCDGNGDGRCDVGDIVAANAEIFSPTSTSTCARQPLPGP